MRRAVVLMVCVVAAACRDQGRSARAAAESSSGTAAAAPRPSGTVIDSALPIAEHLRRFRVGLDSTDRLRGGSPTPERLAARFLDAVARRDTLDLARMVLSRAEFGWVYYPSHIYHDPPYELDPNSFWTLVQGNSAKGLIRVLRRYGGTKLRYGALRCGSSRNVNPPLLEAERCSLRFTSNGTAEARRMFGSIVGNGRTFKFVSYANEF